MSGVSAGVIVDVVTRHAGPVIAIENGYLCVNPPDGNAKVYPLPEDGVFARRIVIQIGKITETPSHLFWHAPESEPPAEASVRGRTKGSAPGRKRR